MGLAINKKIPERGRNYNEVQKRHVHLSGIPDVDNPTNQESGRVCHIVWYVALS